MKIVLSATEEQKLEIESLLNELRNELLVSFFSNDELLQYEEMNLLQFDSKRNLYNGTLAEAAAIMVALGIINHLLRDIASGRLTCTETEKKKFEQNKSIINYYGLFFPFTWEQFVNDDIEHEQSFLIM